MIPRAPVLVLVLVLSFSAAAQRHAHLTWPTSFHIGASFMTSDIDTTHVWSQGLGNTITLQSGIGMRYKKRLGVNVQGGGIVHTYTFNSSYGQYEISKLSFLANTNLYILFPIKTKGFLQIGNDVGYVFHATESLRKSRDQFSVESSTGGGSRLYFSPEIGLSGIGERFQFSLLATYTFNQSSLPVIATQIHDPSGTTRFETKGSYLGLKMRFTYTLAGHREPQNKILPAPPDVIVLSERETSTVQTIRTSSRNLVLSFNDNAELDGDSISVVLNGEYVLTLHELTKEPYQLKLRLKPGKHTVAIQAHNEGRISPNTMKCILRAGRKKYDLTLSASLASNTSIEIIVEE